MPRPPHKYNFGTAPDYSHCLSSNLLSFAFRTRHPLVDLINQRVYLSSGRSSSWNNDTQSIFVVLSLPHCAPTLSRRSRCCFFGSNPHTRACSKGTEKVFTEYATETP